MNTVLISAASADFNEKIQELGALIRRGGLVGFPTETVYGLGGNALDPEAAKKIYAAKGRPSDNPLIVHVTGISQAEKLTRRITPLERKLMEAFWPGPLTIVFPKKDCIPLETSGGLSTVALRCPSHPAARALIEASGIPIAGPSANMSTRPSPTCAEDVMGDLAGRIDAVIDGGPCQIGLESTIIACRDDKIMIYRPGGITREMLEAYGPVELDSALQSAGGHPLAPGMKYRHYAPSAPMVVYAGEAAGVEAAILRSTEESGRHGYFVSQEMADKLPAGTCCFVWGHRQDQEEMARRLFAGLHYFNAHPVEKIIGEGTNTSGIGLAIMNRLTKATGYHIIIETTKK